ncbi:septum formation family protein [Jiangella asiatica]|uniref:Septum formation-related domain-containing protein n=1 Tax=Jiangella asiatica TaxID=2530372 RepID=A0A4R5D872_9ACTN|nr:septum formation family protein [Jiangella asiatica]TDE08100.1 hypothetical protein E1269_18490 [Jiangella asiatica]
MARTIRTAVATSFAGAAVVLMGACSEDGPQRDEAGNITESADDADVFEVRVGDCLGDFGDSAEVSEVALAPCDDEHAQQAYAVSELSDGDFPGDEAFRAEADEVCVAEFETFVGVPYAESELDYTWLQPTEESWEQGDRELVCLVYDPAGPVTGSLEGAGR